MGTEDWYRQVVSGTARGPVAGIARSLFASAEPIYAAVVARKNRAFDSGRRQPTRVAAPVISVGNLTVGGTGSQLVASGQLGVTGGGQLFVSTGGLVQVGTNLLIEMTSSGANAHVNGGTLTVQGGLFMAQQATAELVIENGGQVTVSGNVFLSTSPGTGLV